jgi:ERF superfamily
MSETSQGGTPELNAALAAFQAEAPKVIKDEVGVIPGKDGKQGYKYRYADLSTVNAVALPLLGKHGLSVFAKPGFAGNQFGIVCKLKHSSGEEEEGFYPLPASGTPQQIGSAITYARRYSMLMMTGLAPADDDDDAAAANTPQQFAPRSAAEAFETAAPAPPRREGPLANLEANVASFATEEAGREVWRVVTAAAKDRDISREDAKRLQDQITTRINELRKAPQETYGLALDDDWLVKVQSITSQDDADAALADVATAKGSGHISDERGAAIIGAIEQRVAELASKEAA